MDGSKCTGREETIAAGPFLGTFVDEYDAIYTSFSGLCCSCKASIAAAYNQDVDRARELW